MKIYCDFSSEQSKKNLFEKLNKLEKKEFLIEIKRDYENRSGRQNRYYWGVIVKTIMEYSGELKDPVHAFLKSEFLFISTNKVFGKEVVVTKDTPDLNTVEFEQYCERIRIWALSEYNILIPLPNENIEEI